MFIINTATTNTANVTGVHLELGVSPETIVDVRQWRRSRGVFDHVTSLRNADAPLRLLSLQDFSAQEKAEILRSLDLDVLVDLSGFTQNGEPEVLARRPAGIQVNYLGFPAQMGVRWMDFNLLDNEALPPHFTGRMHAIIITRFLTCILSSVRTRCACCAMRFPSQTTGFCCVSQISYTN